MKYLIALIAVLSTLSPQLSTLAQAPATTAQPLARDATSFNLNRTRLDFGSGQTLKLESGSVFTLEDGATFSIGATAAGDFATALGLGFGNATFADTAARDAASAAATGQLGVQLDAGSLWRASSATAGDWSGTFGVVSLGVGSGAVGAPALSFTTEATTGLYRVGAGQVGVTISGALSHQFNAGSMLFPNGTVALPGLAFLSDSDTGIYRVGANKVGIAANGVLAAQVNETQVWIGSGTALAPGLAFFNAPDTGIYYDDGTEMLSFAVAGQSVLAIDSGGSINLEGALVADTIYASTAYTSPMLLDSEGTVSQAVMYPSGDSNTGFYWPALDQFAVTAGGSQAALFTPALCSFNAVSSANYVTAAGVITGGSFALIKANDNGTAAAPFFTRSSDTDTGLYFSAANEVALSAGGAQVAKWTTSGGLVTGVLVVSGNVSGANGTFSGAVSGTTGTFSGALSATTGTFSGAVGVASLASTAGITATTGAFSGAVSGTTGTFSGAVSGTTGTFSSSVTATALTASGALGGANIAVNSYNAVSRSGGYLDINNTGGTADGIKFYTANSAITAMTIAPTNGNVSIAGTFNVPKTITAGGTTGAQTINKMAGSVNFAAAAASLVVTNSTVTTSSVIVATVGTNDTTMKSVQVVAAAGSFTIYPNAVPTAETRVNFIVIN